MEIHAVGAKVNQDMIERLMAQEQKRKVARPFEDPIREFHRASQVEGIVRNWLTIPLEERKRLVKENFQWVPRGAEEREADFNNRRLERWRALCVIVQEESRAEVGVRCAEVAIQALKLLFPEHAWPKPVPTVK